MTQPLKKMAVTLRSWAHRHGVKKKIAKTIKYASFTALALVGYLSVEFYQWGEAQTLTHYKSVIGSCTNPGYKRFYSEDCGKWREYGYAHNLLEKGE